ncbi:hypothetical protein [Methylobacterium sp. CM6257]
MGFRLEGSGRFGEAARAYELAASIDPRDPQCWRGIAATTRLRDVVERELWDEASAFIAEIGRHGEADTAIGEIAATLLRAGWEHECRYQAEPAVQCYRLAFELNSVRESNKIIANLGITI